MLQMVVATQSNPGILGHKVDTCKLLLFKIGIIHKLDL